MSSEITIRAARSADVPEVSALLRTTWHATYDALIGAEDVEAISARWHGADVLGEQIGEAGSTFLVAAGRDRICGHAFVRETDSGNLELSRLYVLPDEQGKGIGQALLDKIVKMYPNRRIVLEVQENNTGARNFYLQNGFVVTGKSAHCGNDSDVPSILMARACG